MRKKTDNKIFVNVSNKAIWGVLGAIMLYAGVSFFNRDDNQDEVKKHKIEKVQDSAIKPVANTYGQYLARAQAITPFFYGLLIQCEGVHTDEFGLHKPYNDKFGNMTIGIGSTSLPDGSPVTDSSRHLTNQEAYDVTTWHIEDKETLLLMYAYSVGNKYFRDKAQDIGFFLAMADAFYCTSSDILEQKDDQNHKNRMTELRSYYGKYGYNLPDSLVTELFEKYPIQNPTLVGRALFDGKSVIEIGNALSCFLKAGDAEAVGLQWRRWAEAGLMSGDITVDMLMNAKMGSLPEFYFYMGNKNKGDSRPAFIIDSDVLQNRKVNRNTFQEFRNWLKNPVDKKGFSIKNWSNIQKWMPDDVAQKTLGYKCAFGNGKKLTVRMAQLDKMKKSAFYYYAAGDLERAGPMMDSLAKTDTTNAATLKDLAEYYNKVGRYDDAIAQVHRIRRLYATQQYGAAFYHAGYAAEQKGELQRALENYKLSVARGRKSSQQDVDRVAEKILEQEKQNAVALLQNQSLKTAFNGGTKKVRAQKNSFIKGLTRFNDNNKANV